MDPYWKRLGQALKLPQNRIDAITEKYTHVTWVSCTIAMLQKWHDSLGAGATWRVLYEAARHVRKNSLAGEIQRQIGDLDKEGEV